MRLTHTLILLIAPLFITTGGRALAAPAGGTTPGSGAATKGKRIAVELPPQDLTYSEQTAQAQRDQGRRLFKKGNQAFEQRAVDNAYKYYMAAYKLWPHPRVLFNIAVSLGFLSRPLESARRFRKVLRYGPDPITTHRYKQASERYIELMGQLTNLIVTCPDTGAKLFIDGKPIGSAPMKKKITLGPGTHMVTASLPGKVPYSAQVRLEPGELKSIAVSMEAFSDRVRFRSVPRYHWYVPTLVTVAAALLTGGGAAMLGWGRGDIDKLQQEVDGIIRDRDPPDSPFPYDTNREDTAVTMQKAGFAVLGMAGAAAVAAVVLWILQKKKVRYTVGSGGTSGVKIRF
jgi:PEGA domain